MKKMSLFLIGISVCIWINTVLIVFYSSSANYEIETHLKTNQNEIDSLKTELDFRDEMIETFIKNQETDPIGVRVESRKNPQP